MRTVINLILTLLCVGPCLPFVVVFTAAWYQDLENHGHTIWASFLPLIVLAVSIFLIKLLYKGIDALIRYVFG